MTDYPLSDHARPGLVTHIFRSLLGVLAVVVALAVAVPVTADQAAPTTQAKDKPAVLFCTWGTRANRVDYTYLKQLAAQGFTVDTSTRGWT